MGNMLMGINQEGQPSSTFDTMGINKNENGNSEMGPNSLESSVDPCQTDCSETMNNSSYGKVNDSDKDSSGNYNFPPDTNKSNDNMSPETIIDVMKKSNKPSEINVYQLKDAVTKETFQISEEKDGQQNKVSPSEFEIKTNEIEEHTVTPPDKVSVDGQTTDPKAEDTVPNEKLEQSLTNINEENTTTTVKASFTERTTDTKAEDELQNEKLKSNDGTFTDDDEFPTDGSSTVEDGDAKDSGTSSLEVTQELSDSMVTAEWFKEVEDNLSLTDEELDAITETWKPVWKEKKRMAIEFFVKLFTLYPQSKEYFKDFRGLDIEEIRVHSKLRAHGLSVVYAIKSYIDSIDDKETFDALVRKNAQNHIERKVGEKEFKWLAPVFIEVLEDNLKDKVTDLHRKSWTKMFFALAKVAREEWARVD